MQKSIFDSQSEKEIYQKLKMNWMKYVDVFPQIPVKNVIGYEEIQKLDEGPSAKEFLLKTSFDFVVCELNTGSPILVIEFDGLAGGFSREGHYIVTSVPPTDQYRLLKMETKLRVCQKAGIPMIVVSYQESNLLEESLEYITVLDAIIGDAIEKKIRIDGHEEIIQKLSQAMDFGGIDSAEDAEMEIHLQIEDRNPLKRKIKEITEKFPIWGERILFPKPVDNMITGTFDLTAGLLIKDGRSYSKKLLSVTISMRQVGVNETDSIWLFNTIGEYCLARKTQKTLGYDTKKWREAMDNTEMIEL